MKLVVLTPEKEFFSGEVVSLTVPGVSGDFEVLNNHAPLVSELIRGRVKIEKQSGEPITFEISKGFLEVINNDLALLVDSIND